MNPVLSSFLFIIITQGGREKKFGSEVVHVHPPGEPGPPDIERFFPIFPGQEWMVPTLC